MSLEAIGADRLVRQAGFPQKWGATFMSADGSHRTLRSISAAAPGVPTPQTWQVPRATFDDLLLRHAAANGVRGSRAASRGRRGVRRRRRDGDGAGRRLRRGARSALARSSTRSGRGALLSRKFELRVDEPRLANVAVFSHYSGVPRPRRPARRRHPHRRARRSRLVLADPDFGRADERWRRPAERPRCGRSRPWTQRRCSSARSPRRRPSRVCCRTRGGSGRCASRRTSRSVRAPTPAIGGCWPATPDHFSIRSSRPAWRSRSSRGSRPGAADGGWPRRGRSVAAARSRRYARRQRQRYASFRRFVVGFYTPEFRDLFFAENPSPRMFRALVTVFAGYWRPALGTRLWIAVFFQLVRLQRVFRLVPRVAVRQVDVALNKDASH